MISRVSECWAQQGGFRGSEYRWNNGDFLRHPPAAAPSKRTFTDLSQLLVVIHLVQFGVTQKLFWWATFPYRSIDSSSLPEKSLSQSGSSPLEPGR